MSIIATLFILLFAFFINSLMGFGGGLIAVPFLVLLYPLKTIAPLINILGIVSSGSLLKTIYKQIKLNLVIPLCIGNLFGGLLGVHFLALATNQILIKILGIIIILAAINILFNFTLKLKPNKILSILFGLLSGLLSTLFATGGPPLIFYLTSVLEDKKEVRANSLIVFFINGLTQIPLIIVKGLLTQQLLLLIAMGIPILLLGTYFGHHAHVRISEKIYKRLLFGLLLISGIQLLLK